MYFGMCLFANKKRLNFEGKFGSSIWPILNIEDKHLFLAITF